MMMLCRRLSLQRCAMGVVVRGSKTSFLVWLRSGQGVQNILSGLELKLSVI